MEDMNETIQRDYRHILRVIYARLGCTTRILSPQLPHYRTFINCYFRKTMFNRTHPKVEYFRSLIEVNFDSMQADRLLCHSDNEFWAKYGVSASTVRKYMWSSGRSGNNTITLDVEEVNAMREHHTDKYVSEHYGCSIVTIIKNCGSRKSLAMNQCTIWKENYVSVKDSVKSIKERLEKETKVIRKEDRWEYPDETQYWQDEYVVISGNSPMAGIKLEKNTYWHPY